jgi:hypothetical protein
MDCDIGAVVEGFQQDRRRDRVIDNQRYAVTMSDFRQSFNVANIAGRIADSLGKDSLGVTIDKLFDCLRLIAVGKAGRDALARQDVGEQGVRRSV